MDAINKDLQSGKWKGKAPLVAGFPKLTHPEIDITGWVQLGPDAEDLATLFNRYEQRDVELQRKCQAAFKELATKVDTLSTGESTDLTAIQHRLDALAKAVAESEAETADRKVQLKEIFAQADELQMQVNKAKAKADAELATAAALKASEEKLQAEVAELRAELRKDVSELKSKTCAIL
eukprot:TRINITY_DN10169_c0_g1_i2.p1 TRINITY_DN10169_c0_g1~~TRINITY_DN10169_c0_g1_i2.p1  ORF type:complete len:179 (-),score=52.73 TRINITY_DN10169_c0_g1_i2:177-713(-)